jgi:hypothetical protein
MIEKVLRIRKMPTNRATPANPSRMLLKKPSPSCRPAALSSASWSPVLTT